MNELVKDITVESKDIPDRIEVKTIEQQTSYWGGKCSICADIFEIDSPYSREILCPNCKKTILWLKANKNYLDKLVSELKDKSESNEQ